MLFHFILILIQSVYSLILYYRVLSVEPTHIHCLVFGLTRQGIELSNFRTLDENDNHYIIEAILQFRYQQVIYIQSVVKDTDFLILLLPFSCLIELSLKDKLYGMSSMPCNC